MLLNELPGMSRSTSSSGLSKDSRSFRRAAVGTRHAVEHVVEALQEGGGVCDWVLAAGRDDGEIAMLAEHMLCRLCDEAEEVVREVRHDNAEDLDCPVTMEAAKLFGT